jgi:hypothetical protein
MQIQRRGPSVREHSIQKVSSLASTIGQGEGRGETEGAGDIDREEARRLRGTRFHRNQWTSREETKTKNSPALVELAPSNGFLLCTQTLKELTVDASWNRARITRTISSTRS